jgi:hypothetical protein
MLIGTLHPAAEGCPAWARIFGAEWIEGYGDPQVGKAGGFDGKL